MSDKNNEILKNVGTYPVLFSLYRGPLWNWIYIFIDSLDTPKKRLDFISIKDNKGHIIAYYIPELYSTKSYRNTNQAILRDSGGLYDSRKIYNINILMGSIEYDNKCRYKECSCSTRFRSIKFGYLAYCCKDHEILDTTTEEWKTERSNKTKQGFINNNVDFRKAAESRSRTISNWSDEFRSEVRKKRSEANKRRNSYLNLHKESAIESHNKSMKDPKVRLRMSMSAKERVLRGGEEYLRRLRISVRSSKKGYKSGYVTLSKVSDHSGNNSVFYDSLYELIYFSKIDSNPLVDHAIVEPFSIKYVMEGENFYRDYFPDIIVYYRSGLIELIEIKPKNLLESIEVASKSKYAIDYCRKNNMSYKFVTEDEIFLGIDKSDWLEYHRYLDYLRRNK